MMHHLDELILRSAVKNLELAMADMKGGGWAAEIMAALHVNWALSDVKCVLDAPLKETV